MLENLAVIVETTIEEHLMTMQRAGIEAEISQPDYSLYRKMGISLTEYQCDMIDDVAKLV